MATRSEGLKNRNKKPLITFKNLRLAEPVEHSEFEEDEPDVEEFQQRCEAYPELLPISIKLLTASVDVQGGRLEYEIMGWGAGKENWSWEWGTLEGSPGVGVTEGVWHRLYQYLADRTFLRADGAKLTIVVKCLDSGGAPYPGGLSLLPDLCPARLCGDEGLQRDRKTACYQKPGG